MVFVAHPERSGPIIKMSQELESKRKGPCTVLRNQGRVSGKENWRGVRLASSHRGSGSGMTVQRGKPKKRLRSVLILIQESQG